MSKLNINSIEKFSVPNDWIENALSIPEKQSRKAPIAFFKFSRTFAAVASLAIVCALSLTLFFYTQNKNVIPMQSSTQASETLLTESNGYETVSDDTNSDNTSASSQHQNTGTTNGFNNGISFPLVIEPTEETNKETSTTTPTNSTNSPTELVPSETPTEPSQSIEPTEVPTAGPTDNYVPVEPYEPTTAPTEAPTKLPEAPMIDKNDIFVSTHFDTQLLTGNLNVYCKVVDSNGNLVGDHNLYSDEHLAVITSSYPKYTFARYFPYRHNLIQKADYYSFYFYNSEGVIVGEYLNYYLN